MSGKVAVQSTMFGGRTNAKIIIIASDDTLLDPTCAKDEELKKEKREWSRVVRGRERTDRQTSKKIKKKKKFGFAGFRSPYLPHAKRTCYQVHHEPFSYFGREGARDHVNKAR
jgi:hypothetical protein